ncbi:MAG TPA: ABC transporter permease [Clostridiaceae bacterium]|nr:ABC transporter permease [Clostridiaceae bacterium]
MNLAALQGSLELGIIYAIMALGVFVSFRTLNMPDLTVDGSFVLGAAVSAVLSAAGQPLAAIAVAFFVGGIAGCVTALLHTKLKVQPLISGILVMLALYSVNLRVMGNKSNVPLRNVATVYTIFKESPVEDYIKLITSIAILLIVLVLLFFFLKTRLGFVLRATGDNDQMVRALGVNTDFTKLLGLALSNGLVAMSGALIAQYQSFADIGMGVGMVVIGLASVIIGEVIFGVNTLLRKLIAVVLGSIFYRFVIAFAFDLGMPPTDLKLVSAIIVAIALSMPEVKERVYSLRKRLKARDVGKEGNPGA